MENEIPRGHLSTIILSTLLDGDKYGYEILKAVEKQTNGIIKIKQPSLYSSLKRMEDQNLISSYWRDSDIGGRRHYYRLTDLGRKQTIEWQKDLVTSQKCVKEIINKTSSPQINSENNPTIIKQENLFSLSQSSPIFHEKSPNKTDGFMQMNLFEKNIITQPVENEEYVYKTTNSNKELSTYNVRDELTKARKNSSYSDFTNDENQTYKSNNNFDTSYIGTNNVEADSIVITSNLEETNNNIENPDLNSQEVKNKNIDNHTDDAILITETIDLNNLPHVKKIEPSSMILTNEEHTFISRKSKDISTYQSNNVSTPVLIDESNYYESFENLNFYLQQNNYKMQKYSKYSKDEINKTKIQTKINLFTFAIFALLTSITSIILYIVSIEKNLYLDILFLLVPTIIFLLFCRKYLRFENNYIEKYKPHINNLFYQALLALITSVFIFAINLLIGLKSDNIIQYTATLLLPINCILNYLLSTVINILIQKRKSYK